MPQAPKIIVDRIAKVVKAWESLTPEATFAGLTLEQFKAKVQGSTEARKLLAHIDDQRTAAVVVRESSDPISHDTIGKVVNSIRADENHGEDSALYEAVGYVRKSQRKSGLRRTRKNAVVPA